MAQAIEVSRLPPSTSLRAERSQLMDRRGRYSLAPRSLMELEVYLKEQYDDYMYFCHRCSKIVLTVRDLSLFQLTSPLMPIVGHQVQRRGM